MAFTTRNHLLLALSPGDLALTLTLKQELEAPDQPVPNVYFPESGLISIVAASENRRIEVGLIGLEGVTGVAVIMGNDRSPHEAYVQAAGEAQRTSADDLSAACRASPRLQTLLMHFVQTLSIQAAQTAKANGLYTINQRLARWLLMAQDRADGGALQLTHEFLSIMLGIRRAGLTVALQGLEKAGLVQTAMRSITVTDRGGLKVLAGMGYGVPEKELHRLMAEFRLSGASASPCQEPPS